MNPPAVLISRSFTPPAPSPAQRVALEAAVAELLPRLEPARQADRALGEAIAAYAATESELYPPQRALLLEAHTAASMRRFTLAWNADPHSGEVWREREADFAAADAALADWNSTLDGLDVLTREPQLIRRLHLLGRNIERARLGDHTTAAALREPLDELVECLTSICAVPAVESYLAEVMEMLRTVFSYEAEARQIAARAPLLPAIRQYWPPCRVHGSGAESLVKYGDTLLADAAAVLAGGFTFTASVGARQMDVYWRERHAKLADAYAEMDREIAQENARVAAAQAAREARAEARAEAVRQCYAEPEDGGEEEEPEQVHRKVIAGHDDAHVQFAGL